MKSKLCRAWSEGTDVLADLGLHWSQHLVESLATSCHLGFSYNLIEIFVCHRTGFCNWLYHNNDFFFINLTLLAFAA
jgi:hypothetical protein